MKERKAKQIIGATKRDRPLFSDDIWRIIELCQKHPRWSVDRVFTEALAPRIRTSLMFPLTPDMKAKLKEAEKKYDMRATDITYHAVDEWLKGHGF